MALLPVADALDKVLASAPPLPSERVPLGDAHGRVLTDDLSATHEQPPADVSAMDGYAARAADVASAPVTLKVVDEVAAGRPVSRKLQAGEAMRIFTGGVLPDGADTIVIQENTKPQTGAVLIERASPVGKHIRRRGLDFKSGEVLLKSGIRLSGRDLTLAGGMNHPTVPVHRRPCVAILATGDELVPVGTPLQAGQIVASNTYEVAALARSEGASVVDLGIARDRLDQTIEAIRQARTAQADVLVTTGGASVGEHDLVRKALAAEGVALSFWKVAMRPGKPLMHGRLGDMHVLGLPGNPVSAFVCSFLFLLPLIRKLAGRSDILPATEPARLGTSISGNDERQDYMRARLEPAPAGLVAHPFDQQDSSMMATLSRAECLVVRKPHAHAAAVGDVCEILRLPI